MDRSTVKASHTIALEPYDARRLAILCGHLDEHIKQIEQRLQIEIRNRGNVFALYGDPQTTQAAGDLLLRLYAETGQADGELTPEQLHLFLQQSDLEARMHSSSLSEHDNDRDNIENLSAIRTKKLNIRPRGLNQQRYVRAIQTHDINFGIGPAGTGKTYLAVACAVEALTKDQVERILLVRPAVEAGEKLGFLPGDLNQKVDPYLRPLYDALHEMLGFETVNKLMERHIIEIAPLAYMRGRTLNKSFIILDESQNTTREQMKMFLTRIGFGSTAVITGDTTQIDLPRGVSSGLVHVNRVLEGVKEISFTHFQPKDVVRHPLVQLVVEAYEAYENKHPDD